MANNPIKKMLMFKTPSIFSNGGSPSDTYHSVDQSALNESSNRSDPVPKSFSNGPEYLNSLHSKLDYLLLDDSDDSEITELSGDKTKLLHIKRSHWKDINKAQRCDSCSKDLKFGFVKKHNCRRCGEVFCEACCQYRKRLNAEGVPDPHGNIYRVCLVCADLHIQQVGRTRTLTELFCEQRKNKRLGITDELNRLITGFEKNVDPVSSIKSAISSLQVFKVPEWQKSSKWLESSEVEHCAKCSFTFNFISRKIHCRLCGSVHCDKCCKDNLLLYFNKKLQAKAKLIGVVGCPDKEPPISLYLSICSTCEEDLEEHQVQHYHLEDTISNINEGGKICKLQSILENLNVIQKKIEELLPSFQEQLETYMFEGNPDKNIHGQNNLELFAKAHSDISDLFTQYAIVIQGLKDLDMSSKVELKLMQNIISVKCNQYSTGLNTFKNLRSIMDKSFPSKSIEQFQKFANTQAINNTYVMTRQLGMEALNLAVKYNFDTLLAKKLSEVDQVCYAELDQYLQAIGEDKKEHLDVLNNLLRDQMKTKTLVLVDKELAKRGGGEYVNSFLIQRCTCILYSILKLLKSKSSETQFAKSKQCLDDVLLFVTDLSSKLEKNLL